MRLHADSPTVGPVVAVICRCSVWPVSAWRPRGRCGACGVWPLPIPDYDTIKDSRR